MGKLIKSDTFKPIRELFVRSRKRIIKHAPEILTGMGVAGVLSTSVMVAKEAPKAKQALEEAEEIKGEPLTFKEKIMTAGPIYIPSVFSGGMTIGFIIGSNAASRKKYGKLQGKYGALAGAYAVSETLVKAYGDKVIEVLGEEEANKIHDEAEDKVIAKRMAEHPVVDKEVIVTQLGDELCYDAYSDRYFLSNYNKLIECQNNMMSDASPTGFIYVNDWYGEIDLKDMPGGDEKGWETITSEFGIRISTKIADDKRPCLVVSFKRPPRDIRDI